MKQIEARKVKKKAARKEEYYFQVFFPSPFFCGWGSPDCMWRYLTKTLLCIFGLQPRTLGVRLHRVCVCVSIQK